MPEADFKVLQILTAAKSVWESKPEVLVNFIDGDGFLLGSRPFLKQAASNLVHLPCTLL